MEKLTKNRETEKRNGVETMGEESRELKGLHKFLTEEDGMGTVEVILIIVVLVGLVIIFKDQITEIVNNLFDRITKQTGKI